MMPNARSTTAPFRIRGTRTKNHMQPVRNPKTPTLLNTTTSRSNGSNSISSNNSNSSNSSSAHTTLTIFKSKNPKILGTIHSSIACGGHPSCTQSPSFCWSSWPGGTLTCSRSEKSSSNSSRTLRIPSSLRKRTGIT